MDMRNNFWYFGDKPSFRIPFSKDVPLPVDDSPVEINSSSCPTNSIPSEIPLHSNTVDETETNDLHLREEEGQALNVGERNDLMVLLNESKNVFRLGGEPTPFVKHFINTGDHPPVSTAPYRLSPNRKEHLRKEIDNLLAHNIIEECESPYAAPVVLVPKSNGTVRLCIDYHIARPLSNLSKKSTAWKWSEIEQQAFQTLKQCLITPPILRQVDPKKPFIIRTDASSYALGAVLLQGESPTDEQPVEYASRLLSSAEKHYSTTEREALAVVWALNKFRGYIEGAEITGASDHQPLKWLMNLTSPTGRLAHTQ
ncbi:retrovirus-related Pol polyprotein from transposon 297 [Trichonephila clavipes]|nr:retrovirus-related Pol polyprotein from transposon 297 [Trichonephila clavipes]